MDRKTLLIKAGALIAAGGYGLARGFTPAAAAPSPLVVNSRLLGTLKPLTNDTTGMVGYHVPKEEGASLALQSGVVDVTPMSSSS